MQNKYSQYLYFRGEEENPFKSETDLNLNRHMWWHYECHYSTCKFHKDKFPNLDDYIKDILENKVDYGDPDGRLFGQYKNSSPYLDYFKN